MSLQHATRLLRSVAWGAATTIFLVLLDAAPVETLSLLPAPSFLVPYLLGGGVFAVLWTLEARKTAVTRSEWRAGENGRSHAGSGRAAPRRVLIIGAGETAQTLVRELNEHFSGEYAIVGFVAEGSPAAAGEDSRVLGRPGEIEELIRCYRIDEVMLADAGAPGTARSLSPETEVRPARAPAVPYAPVKRGFDILFSLAALAVAAPAVAVAALAIKLTSPGPVLYRQERVGRGGRRFTIYKLRTMVDGAENGTGPVLATRRDPRITPLGRFLRATKLDEVPQFYNVLRGDMSVVGPRPERPCFVEAYSRHIPAYPRRHAVHPGITGLAQVSGGYSTHVHVKLRYDLAYVARCSFWLDLWIVLRTVRAVLRNLNGEN